MEYLDVNKLYKMSIFVLFLYFIKTVTCAQKRWKRNPDFDGKFLPSGSRVLVKSRVHCGKMCLHNDDCLSFFFVDEFLCHLRNDIISSSFNGLRDLDKASYYVLYEGETEPSTLAPAPTTTLLTTRPETPPPVTPPPVTTPPVTPPPETEPPVTEPPAFTAPTPPPVTTIPTFTCPPDDSIYRTVSISDGLPFTYKVVKTLTSQSGAREACISEGAFLARVKTVAKMNMLLDLIFNCPGYFGTRDYYVDGSNAYHSHEDNEPWRFVDDSFVPMSNDFWGLTYPDKPGDENCLHMRAEANFMWDDCDCSRQSYFICEK